MATTSQYSIPQRLRTYVDNQNTEALRMRATITHDKDRLRNTHPPSLFAYATVFSIAAVLDILDVVAPIADATLIGFGVVILINVAFFLLLRAFLNKSVRHQQALAIILIAGSLLFFIPIIGQLLALGALLIVLLLGVRNKSGAVIDTSRDNVVAHLQRLEETISSFRGNLASTLKTMRKTPGLRGSARVLSRATRPLTKASSVASRILRNTIGNMIPIVGIFCLQIWTVIATYKDQKKIFTESQKLLQECAHYESQEPIARNQHQQQVALIIAIQQEAGKYQQVQSPVVA